MDLPGREVQRLLDDESPGPLALPTSAGEVPLLIAPLLIPPPPRACLLPPSVKHTLRKTQASFLLCCCFTLFVVVSCCRGCYFRKVPISCHYMIAPACHQTSQKPSPTLPSTQTAPAQQTSPDFLALAHPSSSCPRLPGSSLSVTSW